MGSTEELLIFAWGVGSTKTVLKKVYDGFNGKGLYGKILRPVKSQSECSDLPQDYLVL